MTLAADNAPAVLGLHHSAYRCRDARETTAFYEGVLGFPLSATMEIKGHPTTAEPIHYLHIFFDIGGPKAGDASFIAFFEVSDRADAGHKFEYKHQWGLDLHFAMTVPSHQALLDWRDRLMAQGIEVEGPIDHHVFTSIYFHDPNGYRLEFAAQNERETRTFGALRNQAHAMIDRWEAEKAAA